LLVNEMSQAKGCTEGDIDDLILAALMKAKLRFPDIIGDEGAA
jgi:hypothetical protein